MSFNVSFAIVSAFFGLLALIQFVLGHVLAGLFFFIACVFFLPPLQRALSNSIEERAFYPVTIGLGLVLLTVGGLLAVRADEDSTRVVTTHNLEETRVDENVDANSDSDDTVSLEGGRIEVEGQTQPVTPPQSQTNVSTITTLPTPQVTPVPNRQQATPVATATPTPTATATPTATRSPISTPQPIVTPTVSATALPEQQARALYDQLNQWLRVGQSLQPERETADSVACNRKVEGFKQAEDLQAESEQLQRQADQLALMPGGGKYSPLQNAALVIPQCLSCSSNAQAACDTVEQSLSADMF